MQINRFDYVKSTDVADEIKASVSTAIVSLLISELTKPNPLGKIMTRYDRVGVYPLEEARAVYEQADKFVTIKPHTNHVVRIGNDSFGLGLGTPNLEAFKKFLAYIIKKDIRLDPYLKDKNGKLAMILGDDGYIEYEILDTEMKGEHSHPNSSDKEIANTVEYDTDYYHQNTKGGTSQCKS